MMSIIQNVKREDYRGDTFMGHSQADKAQTRERILSAAARQIRAQGLESLSIGGLMRSVELTHGGFYNHFDSRAELQQSALERALQDSEARSAQALEDAGSAAGLARFVRGYLSRTHRDQPDTGCAIVALLSDGGRSDDALREVMSEHIERFFDRVAEAFGEGAGEQATVAVCAMVGALGLSRLVTDDKHSDEILRTVRDFVLASAREARAG